MKSKLMSQLACHISEEYSAMTTSMSTPPMSDEMTKKVTKIRRTRQSRNPQLSVARRNERERNRVRQVNDGFARLRERLPVHYQLETAGGVESDCESPDLQMTQQSNAGSVNADNGASSKAKKFSKVETLRAAIQHIRWLEQLLEQPIEMNGSQIDSPQLIIEPDEQPLSCASTASQAQSYSQASSEQFVKLEHQTIIQPAGEYQQQQQQQPDHTQLWIQQHQPSFQQQQYHHHHHHQQQHWYPQTNFMQISEHQQQQLSPISNLDSPAQHLQVPASAPVWYSPPAGLESSPSPQHQSQQQLQLADYQNSQNFHHHQQHQISLYSQ